MRLDPRTSDTGASRIKEAHAAPLRLWAIHGLIALVFGGMISVVFRAWLVPFHQPQRGGPDLPFRAGDLTPLFSVWTQVTARSLF